MSHREHCRNHGRREAGERQVVGRAGRHAQDLAQRRRGHVPEVVVIQMPAGVPRIVRRERWRPDHGVEMGIVHRFLTAEHRMPQVGVGGAQRQKPGPRAQEHPFDHEGGLQTRTQLGPDVAAAGPRGGGNQRERAGAANDARRIEGRELHACQPPRGQHRQRRRKNPRGRIAGVRQHAQRATQQRPQRQREPQPHAIPRQDGGPARKRTFPIYRGPDGVAAHRGCGLRGQVNRRGLRDFRQHGHGPAFIHVRQACGHRLGDVGRVAQKHRYAGMVVDRECLFGARIVDGPTDPASAAIRTRRPIGTRALRPRGPRSSGLPAGSAGACVGSSPPRGRSRPPAHRPR